MMEKKLDTFEELMLDFLAGKLSEDGERKLLHFLQSDISYQQRYKEMAVSYTHLTLPTNSRV